jgi:hypothetical protein
MKPNLNVLGELPFTKGLPGRPKSRIATIFPHMRTLATRPGIHATQRLDYIDWLNERRRDQGLRPLSRTEETAECSQAVDLILEEKAILIRPDPDQMDLAFHADELLQEMVPKHRIKFLDVLNRKVHDAIKRRGECWRITPLPTSTGEMMRMIAASRIGIRCGEIYYYNRAAGTRLLTFHEFDRLGALDTKTLGRQLLEIQEFSARCNSRGYPEVDFFMADQSFSQDDFQGHDLQQLDSHRLGRLYMELKRRFCDAVPPEFRCDDLTSSQWRNRMFAALIGQKDEVVSEETLLGLSSEYYMQIRWLPGGRIEDDELIFDSIFDEGGECTADDERRELCDSTACQFIYNFVREYGDLEYVNIGRVVNSLSRRAKPDGRRDVYIAQIKLRGREKEIISIIRMQKRGVRERLEEEKDLLQAMIESEDYTEYTLDRRLGCRQLGMNLSRRVVARKISERYVAGWTGPDGIYIWSPYFERDYIRGIATDKMPRHRFENEAFSLQFARLLGRAAAPNMIVGRCDTEMHVLFDDGDEVVIEDRNGTPVDIVVGDITGAFYDYKQRLEDVTFAYAEPVLRRAAYLPSPDAFARVYLDAFVERFTNIQDEYRRRRAAFDTLFKYRRYDEAGSFAHRWERVLKRLDEADARALADKIRWDIPLL